METTSTGSGLRASRSMVTRVPRARPTPVPSPLARSRSPRGGARPVVTVRKVSSAEDRLTYPHEGRTFLDGDPEVTGHAHGQLVEREAVRRVLLQPCPQLTHGHEAAPYAVHV